MRSFLEKEVKVQTKYLVIERLVNKYSVCEVCRFFGVPRSGYYAFLKRKEQLDYWEN